MKSLMCVVVVLVPMTWDAAASRVSGEDWATFQHDASRSGVTASRLASRLQVAWSWHSKVRPRMARRGPAKRDPYNKVERLSNRSDFDRVFHVVADSNNVLFGSSMTDQVHCLTASTGEEKWRFFTDGPVRLAPILHKGRVFFGSDDGCVYALDLRSGQLAWRQRIGPSDERLAGDGRVISRWPVRTGIVIYDDTVYVAAGMFPSDSVFLVALDCTSGEEVWRSTTQNLPAQGYLLASPSRVYVPSGRSNPIVFDRSDGKLLRVVNGSGGTYCLLTSDTLVFGPGKTGQLGVIPQETRDQLATFQGQHMVVSPQLSYLHSETKLSAIDRQRFLQLRAEQKLAQAEKKQMQIDSEAAVKEKNAALANQLQEKMSELSANLEHIAAELRACEKWTVPCAFPHSLILAGDQLVVGGDDVVALFAKDSGDATAQYAVQGAAFGLSVAHGRLFVSTDRGSIYCFQGMVK